MASYIDINANWQDIAFSDDKLRQDRHRASRRDEKPRLIAYDLGKAPVRFVPVEPRRRPTSQFKPLRAIDEAALERKRFAAFDLHRSPCPEHSIDDLLCRKGMLVFEPKGLAQFGHAMEWNLPT